MPSTDTSRLIVQGQALLDAQHPSSLIIPLTSKLMDDAEPLRIRVTPQRRLIDGPLLRCDGGMMMRVYAAIQDIMHT